MAVRGGRIAAVGYRDDVRAVFVRPGVGIWGRDLLGAYDWNIEGGIRYMFPSF